MTKTGMAVSLLDLDTFWSKLPFFCVGLKYFDQKSTGAKMHQELYYCEIVKKKVQIEQLMLQNK